MQTFSYAVDVSLTWGVVGEVGVGACGVGGGHGDYRGFFRTGRVLFDYVSCDQCHWVHVGLVQIKSTGNVT